MKGLYFIITWYDISLVNFTCIYFCILQVYHTITDRVNDSGIINIPGDILFYSKIDTEAWLVKHLFGLIDWLFVLSGKYLQVILYIVYIYYMINIPNIKLTNKSTKMLYPLIAEIEIRWKMFHSSKEMYTNEPDTEYFR